VSAVAPPPLKSTAVIAGVLWKKVEFSPRRCIAAPAISRLQMKNAATVARDGAHILRQRRQSCWWDSEDFDRAAPRT
jgi:hypothetical protein